MKRCSCINVCSPVFRKATETILPLCKKRYLFFRPNMAASFCTKGLGGLRSLCRIYVVTSHTDTSLRVETVCCPALRPSLTTSKQTLYLGSQTHQHTHTLRPKVLFVGERESSKRLKTVVVSLGTDVANTALRIGCN